MRVLLVSMVVATALFGVLMILLGASDLEADYLSVGRLLGRDSPGPRVSTVLVGVGALVVSGVLVVVLGAVESSRRASASAR